VNVRPPSHSELELAAKAALTAYGLKVTAVTPIRSWNNPVFRVDTTAGCYALRLHRPAFRSEAHLRGELAFLRYLASSGLAVPAPVPTLTGNFLLELEETGVPTWYCDVTIWLEGEVRRHLEPVAAYQLGLMLARIHLASRALVLPPKAELPRYDAASLLTEASPHDPGPLEVWFAQEDLEVIHEVTRQAQTVFSQLSHDEAGVGTIHKDFILGNCLWHGSNVRVLDFADCGVGPYLYDLAPMLTNFSDEPALRGQFIEGYESLLTLPPKHKTVLPLMEAVRHVSSCVWILGKVRRGEVVPPLERHLEARMTEVRKVMSE
jgi:Ser/Thr protein kinase RdoA (MazF antagonist)